MGDRFNKQINLHTMPVSGPQDKQISTLAHQKLKVYIQALAVFGYVFSPYGHNNMLAPGCIFETAPSVGTVGRAYIPRREKIGNL